MNFLLTEEARPHGVKLLIETLRIMKLSVLLIVATALQVSAKTGVGQSVTLDVKNAPLKEVFTEITRQTGYHFLYTNQKIDEAPEVTIQVVGVSLKDALDRCFEKSDLSYEVEPDVMQIIVSTRKQRFVHPVPASIEPTDSSLTIKGRIVAEDGQALDGASVTIKGTKLGVQTAANGTFEMKAVPINAVLVVSYVGYLPEEVRVTAGANLNIGLKHSSSELDKTLIIAYGTTTERYSVGSVSRVGSEDIGSQPVTDPLQALEGRVPGLVVEQTSGVPGTAIKIQIRGQNTLLSTPGSNSNILPLNNPLFIVDGVPIAVQNTNLNQLPSLGAPGAGIYNNSYSGLNAFNGINTQDIESIEVLRDADATAIYGSRGANGVILITTKKGKAGKTKLGINLSTGESSAATMPKMMNTSQYLAMRKEAFSNDGVTPSGNPTSSAYAPDLFTYDTTKYTNWTKYFLGGTPKVTDLNANLQGGNANTQFILGAGFHRETYIDPGDFSDNRGTLNLNLHHRSVDQKLRMDLGAYYSVDQNNSVQNNTLTSFMMPPDYPSLLNPDGSLRWSIGGYNLLYSGFGNPLAYLKRTYIGTTRQLIGNLGIEYLILPNLSVRAAFGYNTTYFNERDALPIVSQNPANYPVSANDFGTNSFETWIIEPQLEYNLVKGKGRLNVLLGQTLQENTKNASLLSGSGYSSDALLGSIVGAHTVTATSSNSQYNYSGTFGRIKYIWNGRYIISLNARRDGSSNFGPGKQFGNFWSEGGGWIFSEESAVKRGLTWLTYGKLHESYGTTGSDQVQPYQYLPGWTPTNYSYLNTAGFSPSNLYNPDFSWAITKKLEGGLDLGFVHDRLLASIVWFQNRCGNQLVQYTLPEQTGFTGVVQNLPAVVQNSGWELQLNYVVLKGRRFGWSTSVNVTFPQNKLVSFPGIATSNYAGIYVVGKSTTVLNKYQFLGVNDTTGLYEFATSKGTPTYSPALTDERVVGNLDPKYYGGFKNTFTYKGIQLDVFFEFKKQTGYSYLYDIYRLGIAGGPNNLPTTFLSRWQKPGDENSIQRLTASYGSTFLASNALVNSSGVYTDASYIRLKNVSLSYTLPAALMGKRLKGTSGSVFLRGQNLFTITRYRVGDPETQTTYGIPPLRTIVAGIQFTF